MKTPHAAESLPYYLNEAYKIREGTIRSRRRMKRNAIPADEIEHQLIELVRKDRWALTLLAQDLECNEMDSELEQTLRDGWAFLKAVFGEPVAIPLVVKAGALAVIGAQRSYVGLTNMELRGNEDVSVPVTVATNICNVLAEYNCLDGARILPQLLEDIPLTTGDRRLVERAVGAIDHTVTKIH